jgi:chromosome segregation ATPase
MLMALGFLAASLLGLLVASAFWSRAVRLTTARIKQSMPVSEPEIRADRDRLRAEYAIKVHKLEMQLEQAKLERARQLIDLNRRDASISTLETDAMQLKADLEENQNARRVLEQTVTDRLPRVEARLAEAKRLLFNRDREIAELTAGARRHKQALEEVSSINAQKNAQIERLSMALTTRGGRSRQVAGDAADTEVAMRSEIEALRSKSSEQALLIDRLQRRQGHGFALTAPVNSANPQQADSDTDKARRDISEAEAAIGSLRAAASPGEGSNVAFEREIRALKARTEDQAGEIARLKAALVAFEQRDGKAGGLKDSRIALRARLGSGRRPTSRRRPSPKLRAGPRPRTSGSPGRPRISWARCAASVAARRRRRARCGVQHVAMIDAPWLIASLRSEPAAGRRRGPRRARRRRPSRKLDASRPSRPPLPLPTGTMPTARPERRRGKRSGRSAPAVPAAAELPKAGEIPEKRRRPRLLDRITGLAKS